MIASRKKQRGLTLLEMVVVLMISGMALALGFQTLGQWRRTDSSLSMLSARMQHTLMTQRWFQESVRALTPVLEVPFKGTDSELSGISLTPLLASQGGATEVTWRLSRTPTGLELLIVEQGRTLALALEGATAAEFAYLDAEGTAHPQWPPALGQHDPLPTAIALTLDSNEGRKSVLATPIAGIRKPVEFLYEVEEF